MGYNFKSQYPIVKGASTTPNVVGNAWTTLAPATETLKIAWITVANSSATTVRKVSFRDALTQTVFLTFIPQNNNCGPTTAGTGLTRGFEITGGLEVQHDSGDATADVTVTLGLVPEGT